MSAQDELEMIPIRPTINSDEKQVQAKGKGVFPTKAGISQGQHKENKT
ncbi:MAG: hypothetical protein NVS4B11_27840 [Ktedonobacteraceae bacterium]